MSSSTAPVLSRPCIFQKHSPNVLPRNSLSLTFSLKCISTNFPNRLLLLLRTVFAFPKASKSGLAIEKEMKIRHQKVCMDENYKAICIVCFHLLININN